MKHASLLMVLLTVALPLACSRRDIDNGPARSADEVASARTTIERLGGKVVGTAESGPPLRVNFQGSKLSDADLALLAGMTNVLNEICLNQQQISDAGLTHLTA